jgi:hypothetical protein
VTNDEIKTKSMVVFVGAWRVFIKRRRVVSIKPQLFSSYSGKLHPYVSIAKCRKYSRDFAISTNQAFLANCHGI